MLKDLRLKKLSFLVFLLFACNIEYPKITEADYRVNYYFSNEKDTAFKVSFDLAFKTSFPAKVKDFIFEEESLAFLNVYKDLNKDDKVLKTYGKDSFFYPDLSFNGFKYFETLKLNAYMLDFGLRPDKVELLITGLSSQELQKIYSYFSKQNFEALKEFSINDFYYFYTSLDKFEVKNLIRIKSSEIQNIKAKEDSITYLYAENENNKVAIYFKLS